jgi:hypothetical protein
MDVTVPAAFVWNCPTGAPACFPGPQTRVGDVRTGDPIADLCHGNVDGRLKNLIWLSMGPRTARSRPVSWTKPPLTTHSAVRGSIATDAEFGIAVAFAGRSGNWSPGASAKSNVGREADVEDRNRTSAAPL